MQRLRIANGGQLDGWTTHLDADADAPMRVLRGAVAERVRLVHGAGRRRFLDYTAAWMRFARSPGPGMSRQGDVNPATQVREWSAQEQVAAGSERRAVPTDRAPGPAQYARVRVIIVLLVGLGCAWFVRAREIADIADARARYIAESAAQTSATAHRVEHVFQRLYEGLRTMARLGECVARRNPEAVRALAFTEPASQQAPPQFIQYHQR